MSDNSQDWRPAASLETLKLRAQILARIRAYFSAQGVLEVETPILSSAGTTDPNLHSIAAHSLAPGGRQTVHYLHTSPEFAMKRLLAAGSGSIYQITKVFRGGERGRRHNPEFTMLEWYRVDFDYHRLMDDVEALLMEAVGGLLQLATSEKITYRDAFLRHANVDPHAATTKELVACARAHHIDVTGLSDDTDEWLDLLLTHIVEPHLGRGRLTFLYDYPASQAALARIRSGSPAIAERFEVYMEGIELANGFHELANLGEQRQRFARDRALRTQRGLADIPADERLLSALATGLPNCSGVALGVDRLIMLAAGEGSLEHVLTFPFERA